MDLRTHARLRRACVVLLAALAAGLLVSLPAPPASAAGGFKVSIDGNEIVISGNLYHQGSKVLTWSLMNNHGFELTGLHCGSYRIDSHHDHTVMRVPVKYVPNGRWRMAEYSANSDYSKTYRDDGSWFRVRNSPAVSVEITKHPHHQAKSSPVSYSFRELGAIAKTKCRIDRERWRRCSSPTSYDGLSEGRHHFKVLVIGKNSDYKNRDKHGFRLDTARPTAPTVSGAESGWSTNGTLVQASGSTDSGSGIDHYQYRKSTDGGATWSKAVNADSTGVNRQGTTIVRFRAVDGVGRTSAWTPTTVRIDWSAPTNPTITPAGCPPPSFPVTLTATATDRYSGVDHIVWDIQYSDPDTFASDEWPATGSTVTLTQPGSYMVSAQAFDAVGNQSDLGNWDNVYCS